MKILNLKGVKEITKSELKTIDGGLTDASLCYCDYLGYSVDCKKYFSKCPI